MRNCNQGYMQSKTDSHKRCVKIINRSVCSKKGKEFSSHTRKCRKACKINEDRIVRKDKRGTRCRLKCRSNQERGLKYCRKRCTSTQKRVFRLGHRGISKCVNK
jgi:hypothetical protein